MSAGVLVLSLLYTLKVARQQKELKNELDTDLPDKVQEHPYTKNPIFLTYLIAAVLVILFIIYKAVDLYAA
ncbi:hypothetical protein FZC78_14175 [Rossellomorea vietnamensis]|uniref:Uncharacterized protein n=1 Tax=Rossellomorea vietnamensis TaxID=218284 RepID=A0A5D4NQS7_9BACI|nr:hypothetical protein FZC78_14175 [Rossellomorea vietnamensis]